MSMMCPKEGCKAQRGMCVHERAMTGAILLIGVALVVAKLLYGVL